MRIIYIISFPPKYEYINGPKPDFFWLNNSNEKISVLRNEWGGVFARDVKRFFPELEYEVWRPDYRAEKEYVHVFEDGVIHRSFPAQSIYFRLGIKKSQFWTSNELLEKFDQYVTQYCRHANLICHIPLDFSYLGHIILKKYAGKIPFLHTSHLNPNLLIRQIPTKHPLKYLHRLFIKKTYKNHLNLLTEIAVTGDRIDFFKKNTQANVYLLKSLNFDFEWTKNKISKEQARKNLGIHPDSFILFCSSRLVPEKQIDKLLISLSEIKYLDFICIISGAGDLEYVNYLKSLVYKLSLNSKVSFVGFLSENLIEYYCAADVFITTSGSEGGPVSAIKAMALGVPVISTDTGTAAYLLKEHKSGVILDKKSNEHWAEKIREVINGRKIKILDPEQLENEYGLENSIRQLVGYYKLSAENLGAKKCNFARIKVL